MEIWKNIKGYEGLYEISSLGRVKSLKCGKVKILKPQSDSRGYLQIGLVKDKKRTNFKIHRLVAIAFIENINNKPQIYSFAIYRPLAIYHCWFLYYANIYCFLALFQTE